MRQFKTDLNYLSTNTKAQGPLVPWYNAADINTASLPSSALLGEVWWTKGPTKDAGGNAFMWVKTSAGLTQGQVVSSTAPLTGTVTSSGSTVSDIVTNITTTAANVEVDNFIYFVDTQDLRRIKANTSGANATFSVAQPNLMVTGGAFTTSSNANSPADADALAAVPTNGSACTVFRDFSVKVATNALVPVGVALGTVTSGNYTIVQVAGLALVLCVGTSPALTFDVPAIISTTAGSIIGGAGSANAYCSDRIRPRITYTVSTAILVPCDVNFI